MSEQPSNTCRFCEGEGRRFNNAAQYVTSCAACDGRGWRGAPQTDAQHLEVARERIAKLEAENRRLQEGKP